MPSAPKRTKTQAKEGNLLSSEASSDIATLGRLCKKLNKVERQLKDFQKENKLLRRKLQEEGHEKTLVVYRNESLVGVKPPLAAVPTVSTACRGTQTESPEPTFIYLEAPVPTIAVPMNPPRMDESHELGGDSTRYREKYEQAKADNEMLLQRLQSLQVSMENLQLHNAEQEGKIQALESFFLTINAEGHKLQKQEGFVPTVMPETADVSNHTEDTSPTHPSEEEEYELHNISQDDDDATTLASLWEADAWSLMTGAGGLVKRAPTNPYSFGRDAGDDAREYDYGVMLEI